MSRVVVRPYRTAVTGVLLEPPQIAVRDIDINAVIDASVRFEVNPIEVRDSCGLPEGASLQVALVARCDQTYLSSHEARQIEGESAAEGKIAMSIPASQVSGVLELECVLVLAETIQSDDPLVATRKGSLLASSATVRHVLDGEGSHFPTDAISFSASGRERGARWSVEYLYSTLDEPLLGSVRLLINTDAKAWSVLSSPKPDRGLFSEIGSELRRYVLSDMVKQAVLDEDFTDGLEWPEASVGRHFDNVIKIYGGGRSVAQLRTLLATQRPLFEQVLQALESDTK